MISNKRRTQENLEQPPDKHAEKDIHRGLKQKMPGFLKN
jgi:hypothetical protein